MNTPTCYMNVKCCLSLGHGHGHGHGHGLFIKTRVTEKFTPFPGPPPCPGCYADLFRAPLHEVLPNL